VTLDGGVCGSIDTPRMPELGRSRKIIMAQDFSHFVLGVPIVVGFPNLCVSVTSLTQVPVAFPFRKPVPSAPMVFLRKSPA